MGAEKVAFRHPPEDWGRVADEVLVQQRGDIGNLPTSNYYSASTKALVK